MPRVIMERKSSQGQTRKQKEKFIIKCSLERFKNQEIQLYIKVTNESETMIWIF